MIYNITIEKMKLNKEEKTKEIKTDETKNEILKKISNYVVFFMEHYQLYLWH